MPSKVIDRWSVKEGAYASVYLLKKISCGFKNCRDKKRLYGPYLYKRSSELVNGKLRRVERYVGKPGSEAYQRAILVCGENLPNDLQMRSEDL